MIELGYMAKRIVRLPEWLDAPSVRDVFSVANCISDDFCDYVTYWKFNGYWFFDSPELIRTVAHETDTDLADASLLYYRGYGMQYVANSKSWESYEADPNFATDILLPNALVVLG